MRAIMSSRKITISCPKNFMRHGLLMHRARGTRARRRVVNVARSGRRGSRAFAARSRGPGTKIKCVVWVMRGYAAIRSASASNPSARTSVVEVVARSVQTLVFLNVAAVSLCNAFACEVAAHHNDHRDVVILDTVVEHLSEARKSIWVV